MKEGVEVRDHKLHDDDRQRRCKEGRDNGFTQELSDQLTAVGTRDLSESDLSCASSRPSRGEIREVDTGDGEDDGRDRRELVDPIDIAPAHVVISARVEVYITERLEVVVVVPGDLRTHVAFDERGYLRPESRSIVAPSRINR